MKRLATKALKEVMRTAATGVLLFAVVAVASGVSNSKENAIPFAAGEVLTADIMNQMKVHWENIIDKPENFGATGINAGQNYCVMANGECPSGFTAEEISFTPAVLCENNNCTIETAGSSTLNNQRNGNVHYLVQDLSLQMCCTTNGAIDGGESTTNYNIIASGRETVDITNSANAYINVTIPETSGDYNVIMTPYVASAPNPIFVPVLLEKHPTYFRVRLHDINGNSFTVTSQFDYIVVQEGGGSAAGSNTGHTFEVGSFGSDSRQCKQVDVSDWCDDEDGCRIDMLFEQGSTGHTKVLAQHMYWSRNANANGTYVYNRQEGEGDYSGWTGGTSKHTLSDSFHWAYIFNYHDPQCETDTGAYSNPYLLNFVTVPDVKVRYVIYDN